jgi:hypothetical protein
VLDPETTQGRAPLEDASATRNPAPPPSRAPRAWTAALVAAALASVLGWQAGEAAVRSIPTETEGSNVNGENKEIVTVLSSYRSEVKRAVLAYGLQGAILAVSLGLAGAAARRSFGTVPAAALAGLIAGGGASAGLSAVIFPAFFRQFDPISGDLLPSLIAHAAAWSAVGAAGGLAFGIGLRVGPRDLARSVLGGLAGVAVGSIAYEFLGAFAFPQARTDLPLAASPTSRLLAQALIGMAVAAGTVAVSRPVRPPTPA